LERGIYWEGVFKANLNNRNRAFVSVQGLNVDIMLDSLYYQNRALDGDKVVLRLLNPAKWPENL